MPAVKPNLLDFDRQMLRAWFARHDEKPYRADQIINWVHQRGVIDWADMTNLSKSLRAKLSEKFSVDLPEVALDRTSSDRTRKWLLRFSDNNCIEMVYIPQRGRGTLCVSSQVGCALNCSFCSTGKQGFSRDLSLGEIIGQVWIAVRELSKDGTNRDHALTNVVMMGMGEPLMNYDNVLGAMNLMLDDQAYGLSKYRVTLSTSGLIPQMLKLKDDSPVALAVSLHAPSDELRNELVPINKKYPLKELMSVCKAYYENEPRRSVTFEYVMLAGVNDQPKHAAELIRLLNDVPCKVNLIPFNPFPHAPYQSSSPNTIESFQHQLQAADINTIVRLTRGDDIIAACGQLVGDFKDKTPRRRRWLEQASEAAVSV